MTNPTTRLIELPVMTRLATVRPSTLDPDNRTVEVVISTGARRRIRGWDGYIEEEIPVTEEALDMVRLNSVAPVLDNHRHWGSAADVIGAVERGSCRIEAGQLIGRLKFARTEKADAIWQLIVDDILRAVSVGYDADYEHIRARDREDDVDADLYRATRWEPYEVSVVTMPADAGATMRGEEPRATRTYRMRSFQEDDAMTTRSQPPAGAPETSTAPAPAPASSPDHGDVVARTAEQIGWFRNVLRAQGLDDALAEKLVREHRGDDAKIRVAIQGLMSARTTAAASINGTPIEVGTEQADHDAHALRSAFVQRMVQHAPAEMETKLRTHLSQDKASGIDRQDEKTRGFGRLGLLDMARQYLRSRGISPDFMSKSDVADAVLGRRSIGGAHTTSDFPLLLAAGANTILLARLAAQRSPIQEVFRRRDLPDFRTVTLARRGAGPALLDLAPGAEIKRGSLSESGEDVRMSRRARGFTLDRTMIINDNLGAFTDGVETMMESVLDSRQEILESPFIDNPTLKDGNPLFFAAAGTDLTSAYGAPSTSMIHAVGALMARQVETIDAGIGTKKRRLTRRPGAWIAGYDEAITLDLLLNAEYTAATAATGRSPRFRNQPVYDVNALLDITHRPYFGVDPNDSGLVYGMLEGEAGPIIRQEEGFWQDGISFAVIDSFYSGVESRGGVVRARISDPGA